MLQPAQIEILLDAQKKVNAKLGDYTEVTHPPKIRAAVRSKHSMALAEE